MSKVSKSSNQSWKNTIQTSQNEGINYRRLYFMFLQPINANQQYEHHSVRNVNKNEYFYEYP